MNHKLNVRRVIEIYHAMTEEYGALVGIAPGHGVHVREDAMTQVAPLSVWDLNVPASLSDDKTVYSHRIQINGVTFFAQSDTPMEFKNDPEAPF